MIEIKHLRKAYANVTPLKDVNAVINEGDVISIIGPSGTGKSTLLRCINLLEQPTSGQIIVDGQDICDPSCDICAVRQKMGMVFQSFNLFGHMTVIENIMFAPIELLHLDRQAAFDRGMELLRTVGLAEKYLNYADELSGGQKQRVAIARTLAMDPEIILLDEPTSALDPTMVGEVQSVIRELAASGKTMMIVTHEMRFARSISNRVFYMDEGGIYEDGSPDTIFEHPTREKTRQFVHRLKVLEIKVESRDFDKIGAGSQIESYCYRNQISPRVGHQIRAVFEELVWQILLPELPKPRMLVSVEHTEEGSEPGTHMTIRYHGDFVDPAASDNQLAYRVAMGMCASIDYGEEDGQQVIRLQLKG